MSSGSSASVGTYQGASIPETFITRRLVLGVPTIHVMSSSVSGCRALQSFSLAWRVILGVLAPLSHLLHCNCDKEGAGKGCQVCSSVWQLAVGVKAGSRAHTHLRSSHSELQARATPRRGRRSTSSGLVSQRHILL